jgi:hypothetical protein
MTKKLTIPLLAALFLFMFSFAAVSVEAAARPTLMVAATAEQTRIDNSLKTNPIVKDIQTIVDFLSAGVGIVVVAMIILGGIQYSLAGDNAQAVSAAKKRIVNALIALITFMFMFAFVQWLIPGGIFG